MVFGYLADSITTVEYIDNVPSRVHTVVISTQHTEAIVNRDGNITEKAKREIINKVIKPVIMAECPKMWNNRIKFHINPTGRFVIGGPHGDSGLTGRKIIVDTYGGRGRHGGGAFSGKDPSKVDRSAAYMARDIAKTSLRRDWLTNANCSWLTRSAWLSRSAFTSAHTARHGLMRREFRSLFGTTSR